MKIPYLSIPDTPLVSSTQAHLPIAEITEDIVLYKDGGAALVMESTSLNFGLLSEKEQQAVIAAYAALLNSLAYPLQIVVRSQRKDITSYMDYLNAASQKMKNPGLANLMEAYKLFIVDAVKKKNVLGKRFFLVIPFSSLELGVAKSFATFAKRKGPLPFSEDYVLKKAKDVLYPRRDHLIRQAGRLGIKLRQLYTNQIIELVYNIFNPAPPSVQAKEELAPPPEVSGLPAFLQKRPSSPVASSAPAITGPWGKKPKVFSSTAMLAKKELSLVDVLSPQSVELDFDYLRLNDVYVRTLYTAIRRRYASPGWIEQIINFDSSLDISFHIYPVEGKSVLDDLRRKIAEMEAEMETDIERGKLVNPVTQAQLEDALALQEQLVKGIERFFDFSFYINIPAAEIEELNHITSQVKSTLRSLQIE